MDANGGCPSCGRVIATTGHSKVVADPDNTATVAPESTPARYDAKSIDVRALAGDEGSAPWHFKLLVVAVVGYLLWRVVQLVVWVL
jgi:hypothetical protein